MAVIDPTSMIGSTIVQLDAMTGSTFLSLLFITIVVIAICLGFRLPLELSAIAVFPLLMVSLMVTSNLLGVLAALVIYLSALVAKHFFFN